MARVNAWLGSFVSGALRNKVPGYEDMDFKDIVTYLVDVFETAAPDEPTGFSMPIESFKSKPKSRKKKLRLLVTRDFTKTTRGNVRAPRRSERLGKSSKMNLRVRRLLMMWSQLQKAEDSRTHVEGRRVTGNE